MRLIKRSENITYRFHKRMSSIRAMSDIENENSWSFYITTFNVDTSLTVLEEILRYINFYYRPVYFEDGERANLFEASYGYVFIQRCINTFRQTLIREFGYAVRIDIEEDRCVVHLNVDRRTNIKTIIDKTFVHNLLVTEIRKLNKGDR